MVSKKVLKKIGVFAVAALVSVSPVLAVNANGGVQLPSRAVGTSDPGTSDPAPSSPAPSNPAPSAPAASGSSSQKTELVNNSVTTESGERLVSTVPGSYTAVCVSGVAVVMPRADVKDAFGAGSGDLVSMEAVDTQHGELAEKSISDGLGILKANHVEAVKGPVLDFKAYLNGEKVTDIDSPVTIAIGIPSDFREEGYEYAVICVQRGGRVSILINQSEDPTMLKVETTGFGVFAIIKAPAGSFDSFK